MIPKEFGVNVATPEPLKFTIDVSERTMMLAGFIVVVGALAMKRLKG